MNPLSIFKPLFATKKLIKRFPFKTKKDNKSSLLVKFQKLGQALLYPIAILPFAALLNRLGILGVQVATQLGHYHEVDWWIATIVKIPGATFFNYLPLFFALGVGFGLAKDNRGEAALVSAMFYLILSTFLAEGSLPSLFYSHVLTFQNDKTGAFYSSLFYLPTVDTATGQVTGQSYILDIGVLGGVTSGIISSMVYNRYKTIKLPQYLAFFGGRRFVPMILLLLSIPVAFLFAIIWPWLQYILVAFGRLISTHKSAAIPGAFFYGVINRLLQPFGLHHILNTFLWFQLPISGPQVNFLGEVISNGSITVNGDITAFNKGIANAGVFTSGYFPVFMGEEPGFALAMIFAVTKGRKRKEVSGFLIGVAIIAFLTGIDEPLVFCFIFVSPLLWFIYAFYTGISCLIITAMSMHIGFGFSAGLIDYIISFAQSWGDAKYYGSVHGSVAGFFANPLWVFPVSIFMFVISFITFYYVIKKRDIPTLGRGENTFLGQGGVDYSKLKDNAKGKGGKVSKADLKEAKFEQQATAILHAIGGPDNVTSYSNCATRLRLVVNDNKGPVNDQAIKAAGAPGIVRLGSTGLQIIIGVQVENVAQAFGRALETARREPAAPSGTEKSQPAASAVKK